MKPYYIKIHFDGPYVDGFVVPQARDEQHALKIIKQLIRARIEIEKNQTTVHLSDESHRRRHIDKLRQYMRSLKRPWRSPGRPGLRSVTDRRAKSVDTDWKVVDIEEMQLPVHAGYWLDDVITGHYL